MKKLNQNGFHVLPLLVLLLVIGAVGFTGYRVMNKDKDSGSKEVSVGKESAFAKPYMDVCKNRDVKFTAAPVPLDQMGYIEPLGKMNDGHVTPTDHVYVAPKSLNAADNTTDVTMPADGTVVEVAAMPDQYIGDTNQQTADEDHRLVVAHSCRYFSIFIHIHQLSPALKAAVGDLPSNQSKRVNVELKAGDKLGKIGGNPVDWTPVDTDKVLKGYITPSLYASESWKIHTVSPFDLYSGDMKAKMEAKSLRTVEPLGGKIDYDQPGKLIGNWFRQGSGGYAGNVEAGAGRYWDGHLAVVPDAVDPKSTIVSIGNWDGTAQQLAAKNGFDPSKITAADGLVKVELAKVTFNSPSGSPWFGGALQKGMTINSDGALVGTIAFQVLEGEKLKVEKFIGKSAAQVTGFTSAAQTYER